MSDSLDFALGNTSIVGEEFKRKLLIGHYSLAYVGKIKVNYLPYDGLNELKELFVLWVNDIFGINISNYKILVVDGATNGLYIIGKWLKKNKVEKLSTRDHYYHKLPKIINVPLNYTQKITKNDYVLLEVPSNPLSKTNIPYNTNKLILDFAYFSPAYFPTLNDFYNVYVPNNTHTYIFSMNKVFGFNSLRLGFIATADEDLYNFALDHIAHSSMNVSFLVQDLAKYVFDLPLNEWLEFFTAVQTKLNNNKLKLKYVASDLKFKRLNNNAGIFEVWEVPTKFKHFLANNNIHVHDASLNNIKPSKSNTSIIRINAAQLPDNINKFCEVAKRY